MLRWTGADFMHHSGATRTTQIGRTFREGDLLCSPAYLKHRERSQSAMLEKMESCSPFIVVLAGSSNRGGSGPVPLKNADYLVTQLLSTADRSFGADASS